MEKKDEEFPRKAGKKGQEPEDGMLTEQLHKIMMRHTCSVNNISIFYILFLYPF